MIFRTEVLKSRRRAVVIAIVICVSLTSLTAGMIWRHWLTQSESAVLNTDYLRQYEDHWKVLNAQPVRVDDWNGQAVLLNFWGSWCPPCIEEMPLLEQFNAEHPSVQIVGIVVDQEETAVEFLNQHDITFPSLLMNQSIVTDMLKYLKNTDFVLPYSVAYDSTGESLFTKAGPLSESDLLRLLP